MGRPRLPPGEAKTNAERCKKHRGEVIDRKGIKKYREDDAARKLAEDQKVYILMNASQFHSP